MTSGQEMEWVYSYNPGTHTGTSQSTLQSFVITLTAI